MENRRESCLLKTSLTLCLKGKQKLCEPCDNMREILQNVAKFQGVSNMRKLGHLNNFTKLLCNTGHAEEKLGFTYDSIIICLRLALLNEAKEVRAAGLRALRYLIRDSSILQKVLKLKVDYLIAREDREARFLASKMGIVAAFRSWAGIISLCKPGNSGIQSLIGVLCIPNMEIRIHSDYENKHVILKETLKQKYQF
ncbi:rapamycin-insensitive companion of hypothetical protein [Limosa lapponica baueri]|uniref:Rapamycin-insensitive companion of mTOR N-terminal domain-containing protein n=1 Tax=Limosa lapponica baueri TaxID=1758121 RepID=A0A2I0TGS4_LIMLA|nr:rapamycin-insensitive companion of hypothetical protein [Limosa lapponica baueri]